MQIVVIFEAGCSPFDDRKDLRLLREESGARLQDAHGLLRIHADVDTVLEAARGQGGDVTGVDLLAMLQPVQSLDHLPAQVVQAPSESQVHRDLELLGVLEDLLDSMSLLMDPQRKPKLDGLGDRVAAILHDVVDYHVAFHDQPRIPDVDVRCSLIASEVDREAEHGGIMECLGCGVQPHVCDVVFVSSALPSSERALRSLGFRFREAGSRASSLPGRAWCAARGARCPCTLLCKLQGRQGVHGERAQSRTGNAQQGMIA